MPIIDRKPDPGPEGVRMSFGDHLEELRRRVLRAVLFAGLMLAVCLLLQDSIFAFISRPFYQAVELANQVRLEENGFLGQGRSFEDALALARRTRPDILIEARFRQIAPAEAFMGYLTVALYASIFFSSPYILYQIWLFVSAGLYVKERRMALLYAPASLLLFVVGIAFGYFFMIPWGLKYFFMYADPKLVDPGTTLTTYLEFFLQMTVIFGAIFELPLVMMFMSWIGLISPKTYGSQRRLAIVLILAVAAVITPPDPFSQILVAVPLYALYEVGILLARIKHR